MDLKIEEPLMVPYQRILALCPPRAAFEQCIGVSDIVQIPVDPR